MSRQRMGFTFIEVLACLLVLSLGMAAAVGLTLYAGRWHVSGQRPGQGHGHGDRR